MLDKSRPASFMVAMKDFFGVQPNQTLTQFGAELKALSPADRDYFIVGLRANGYDIMPQGAIG